MAGHDAGERADKDANGGASGDASTAAEAVARRSYGKLIAYLSARTRDVAGAIGLEADPAVRRFLQRQRGASVN